MQELNPSDKATKSENPPTVAVVVPVFNRKAQLERTLDSIEAQTLRPDVLVLVDNGSTDGSREYLRDRAGQMRRDGWTVHFIVEERRGAARARQSGLEVVDTDYVMFFDSDDIMPPGHIEGVVRELTLQPDIDIYCWNVRLNFPDGRRRQRNVRPRHILDNHMVQGLLCTASFAVRTSFINRAGGWNAKLGGWDDYELGLRLLLAKPVIFVTTEAKIDVTVQEESISGLSYGHRQGDWEKTLGAMEEMVKAWSEGGGESKYIDPAHLLRLLAYRRAILAAHYNREGLMQESRELLTESLGEDTLKTLDKLLIMAAYHHTRLGLPGAGALYPRFIS